MPKVTIEVTRFELKAIYLSIICKIINQSQPEKGTFYDCRVSISVSSMPLNKRFPI